MNVAVYESGFFKCRVSHKSYPVSDVSRENLESLFWGSHVMVCGRLDCGGSRFSLGERPSVDDGDPIRCKVGCLTWLCEVGRLS